MSCTEMTALLHGMLDRELDLVSAMRFEEHMRHCPACAQTYSEQQTLRARVRRSAKYTAPAHLRSRIEEAIEAEAPRPSRVARWGQRLAANWRWAGGAAVAVAASLLLFVATIPQGQDDLQRELIAGHLRSLLADHLTDVASSDRHTVKPWFTGKLDFSPPVADLTRQGFPLIGGRLDYIDDRVVAALVYHRGGHVINLFVWPDRGAGETTPHASAHEGFHVLRWARPGMRFAAVSDLNLEELEDFERLLRAQPPS
jgi:mycothiol system anti-sigma-R factor